MADDFSYKPKFVDIRVKRPSAKTKPEEQAAAGEKPCDHVGCPKKGVHKAPKKTGGAGRYWYFCQEHASEYNRRYDYFKDMSAADIAAHQRGEEIGHRPVWKFRPGRGDRVSATRMFSSAAPPGDAYGLFEPAATRKRAAPQKRKASRVETLALDVMSLEEDADANAVRTRYAELVKRYHPDSNGGDRSAETQLQKVIRAFKTLKAAGRA
jgi:hypothetical protein